MRPDDVALRFGDNLTAHQATSGAGGRKHACNHHRLGALCAARRHDQ